MNTHPLKQRLTTIAIIFLLPLFICAQSDSVFSIVDQMPHYPGGDDSLVSDIASKVIYPKQCADSNIQGKVYLRFIVNEDGSTSKMEVIKSPHPLLKAAALEAAKEIKKFIPGKNKGELVKVWYTVPVNFRIKPVKGLPEAAPADSLISNDGKFTFVEQNPEFPGGDAALMAFLATHIKYPVMERDNDIQGKVLLRFAVDEEGAVGDINIVRGVSPGLDSEAVRLVKLLPKFKPGLQQGKPVKVYFNLPVGFRLNNGSPKKSIFDEYPGKFEGFAAFITDNVIFPEEAKARKMEAVLTVLCVINEGLQLVPVKVLNDLDSLFTKEAFRLISIAPPFSSSVRKHERFNETLKVNLVFTFDRRHRLGANCFQDIAEAKRLTDHGADYYSKAKYEAALDLFDAAIEHYSLYGAAFYNRAATNLKRNKAELACDDFKRAYLLGELDGLSAMKQTCK
jgi:TonB family protein